MDPIEDGRRFLKAGHWREWATSGHETDQRKGVPAPPVQKPVPPGARLVDLVAPDEFRVGTMPLIQAVRQRKSRRRYAPDALSLEEASFLLWATQGLREPGAERPFRTVPSGGARHAFETYLLATRIDGVAPGLYRYLPLDHRLCSLSEDPSLPARLADACCGQGFIAEAAAVFVWTAIPYRMEWRYTILAHKVIAIDAGHVCQNLYLACESIGAGTCAIGAYYQKEVDTLLGVDGEDEFTVYLAPVGKAAQPSPAGRPA